MSKLPDGFYHLTPHSDELKPSKAINKKKLTIIDQNRTDYNIRKNKKEQAKPQHTYKKREWAEGLF